MNKSRNSVASKAFFVVIVLSFFYPGILLAAKLNVYTVNYPLTYFAERIGGDHIKLNFPAPPDVDPAFWTPDTETIKKYQQADVILQNGAGYSKWMQKVSLPRLRTVNTSKTLQDRLIATTNSMTHSHGPEGDHSHGGTAFTTWLDFSQAVEQAEAIYKAFCRKSPEYKEDFTRNFSALKKDLLALDRAMLEITKDSRQRFLLASHPIYQYLARRYQLNLKMVMWEPDQKPSESEWLKLQDLLQEHPADFMIWEGEPLASSIKRLQNLQVKSTIFSPCFAKPEQGDFLSVMQENINNLKAALN